MVKMVNCIYFIIIEKLYIHTYTYTFIQYMYTQTHAYINETLKSYKCFPGGILVKNLPASAGDTGSSPGPGRSHMPWSN